MLSHRVVKIAFYSALSTCLVVSLTAVYISKGALQDYREVRSAHALDIQVSHRYLNDNEWLAVNSALYQHYIDQGLLKKTDRFEWIDLLDQLHQSLAIEDYQFEFGVPDITVVSEDVSVQMMDISLQGRLLHDGVLADLLNQVSKNALGGWMFQSLEVLRDNREPQISTAEGGLSQLSVVLSLKLVSITIRDQSGQAV